jgi:hypothetical protein
MTESIQGLPVGFGSYLQGIIPPDQATAAGAFAQSMMQIKNITKVDPVRFGQVVYSIETNANLPLINGTNVPTDNTLADEGLSKIALGSGVYGTYTYSDFFGCMSGLPYPLQDIKKGIQQLQSSTLIQIYSNLYLAVKWQQAILTAVATEVTPGNWQLTDIQITDAGGGYGRDGAGAPVITLNNGATSTCTIGTDGNDLTTFGKIIGTTITNPGTSATNNFGASVASPPTFSPGNMDSAVQAYITAANAEILAISTATPSNVEATQILNLNWNITGKALKIEQRTRFNALPPVPVPRDNRLNPYPSSILSFVDSMPSFSQDTFPHGAAQTVEALSDPCLVGGQSVVGTMRQSRNQARLEQIGIPLDNNIPDLPSITQQKVLLTAGTLPEAVDGIVGLTGNYTIPAWSVTQNCDNVALSPNPIAYYDSTQDDLLSAGGTAAGNTSAILNNNSPIVSTNVPIGPGTSLNAGNILPPNLNTAYTSSTLLPATFNDQQAIDSVIECNCDCWVQ